ncbi:uncharacterized protein LOC111404232 [Olea europaea var. sylvestris]|uniref:uncharacterized protein LOC111404232 n=1 Tax=Olea europaea var. sylvestris TaxID=158386 RepID=UPI000C1CF048|nr:uncharacterized protein LOC111404232 [Olea europaea var. sylvestris]
MVAIIEHQIFSSSTRNAVVILKDEISHSRKKLATRNDTRYEHFIVLLPNHLQTNYLADRRNQNQTVHIDSRRRVSDPRVSENHNLGTTQVDQHIMRFESESSTSNEKSTKVHLSELQESVNLLNIPTTVYVLLICHYCKHCGARKFYRESKASQVAAVWVEDDENTNTRVRDIIIYGHSSDFRRVYYYYGCYDSLHYPLIFPLGEFGWHEGIQRCKNINVQPRNLVDYVAVPNTINYEIEIIEKRLQCLMEQRNDLKFLVANIVRTSYKLGILYVVDMYVKIETVRLYYFRKNQKQIRAELYQGIVDSVQNGKTRGCKIGKKFVLPQSFTYGPRDMLRRYLDAMAIVQRFEKSDIFLIITCNPNWPEIKQELKYNDKVQNRSDLIARIFRAKLEELKNDLCKEKILGPIVAHIYMVEFQKRGLPHVHFLLIFNCAHKIVCAEQVDKIVSYEILDENKYSHLHSVIVRHNMHGRCGNLNPKNVCMLKTTGCKNKYPRDYCNTIIFGDNLYPLYKRCNNSILIKVRGHKLDSRWVVPYNPYLSAKFDRHINVEICSSIKVVKYFYVENFFLSTYQKFIQLFILYNFTLKIINKNEFARTLLYKDFSAHFVWNGYKKIWTPRKQQLVIGRIVTANPSEGERYFLRILLNHIKGPTSFDDLKTLNRVTYATY